MVKVESVGVSYSRRAISLLLDLLVINLVIIYPFRGIFVKYFGKLTLAQSFSDTIILPTNVYLALFFISLLALLYFTFFDYYLGQTPGMMILKLKSISLRSEDQRIGLWTAILRNCFILPFLPFYIFWVVEPIYLAFYKERLLEKITFTKTVNEIEKFDRINSSDRKDYYKGYKLGKV